MGGVYLVRAGYQVKAGGDNAAVPDNWLPGLIQAAFKTGTVRALGNALHRAIGVHFGNGVGAEIRDVEIPLAVKDHAVGGLKLGGVFGKGFAILKATVRVKGYAKHFSVPEIPDVEIPFAIKHNAVYAVLTGGVLGYKGGEQVFI